MAEFGVEDGMSLKSKRMSSGNYDRILEVTRLVDGIPVTLALQKRMNAGNGESWWTLSWRTRYSAEGTNRRFYMTKNGCWTIPVAIALDMIVEIGSRGGLSRRFFDHRGPPSPDALVSSEMTAAEKTERLCRITSPAEDWGISPFFVIVSDPSDQWKKVLIIDTETDAATFRSITESPDYKPKKVLRPNVTWWLDNSMMDANVQQMRVFHQQIQNYPAHE